jgi:hypothetical protein
MPSYRRAVRSPSSIAVAIAQRPSVQGPLQLLQVVADGFVAFGEQMPLALRLGRVGPMRLHLLDVEGFEIQIAGDGFAFPTGVFWTAALMSVE